ncbi:hypothetical protein IWW54_002622 [Coemansia sp. RSA 2705]|nr:hypothetical protein IWW54_002622 [Coemansia sp. RSA 2705]
MDKDGDDDVCTYMSRFDAMLLEINTNDLTMDMTSPPHTGSITGSADSVLAVVHSDIAMMPISDWKGRRYFVTFTDEFSHLTVTCVMNAKSDVLVHRN